jgi:hypothetical protein
MPTVKSMDAAQAIGSLLTRYDLVACRPTGLRVVLSKSGYLIYEGKRNDNYVRLQVGDLCAGDWFVEQLERGRTERDQAA